MDNTNLKIAIAIPENRDVILKGMFWGFMRFLASVKAPVILMGNDDDLMVPGKTSYIDNMRNRMVKRAQELDCSHIFFIDSDTIPPVGALEKLLEADKDIIAGVYRFRVPPYRVLAFWYSAHRYLPLSDLPEEDKCLQVDAAGMGCTLIKMDVFKKIEKPWYQNGYTRKTCPYDLKKDRAAHRRYVGEDVYFSEQAAAAGYKLWLHTGVRCDHITQTYVPGNLKTPEIQFENDHVNKSLITFGGL